MLIEFENSVSIAYSKSGDSDPFLRYFMREWMGRKCCYDCSFRNLRGCSDLTIGDFWGVEKVAPKLEDASGISVALVHGIHGAEAIRSDRIMCYGKFSLAEVSCSNNRIPLLENPYASRLRPLYSLMTRLLGSRLTMSVFVLTDKCFCFVWHCLWWAKRLIVNREMNRFVF